MAFATVQDVKDYFRIQTAAEDALLAQLLARARGEIESLVGKSLTSEEVEWRDDVRSARSWDPVTSLQLGYVPVDPASVEIADVAGAAIAGADFVVRQDLGQVVAVAGVVFANGPYVITADAGFEHSPTYATVEEPMINALVIDLVGFYYQQRTPGASSEASAGTRVDYGAIDPSCGLPTRVMKGIRKLKGVVC